jgi:hypothetical protein
VAEHEIGYVSNGMFIAAAVAAGFTVEQCSNGRFRSPNAFFQYLRQGESSGLAAGRAGRVLAFGPLGVQAAY